MPDVKPGGLKVHVVVGQHESHAFMLAKWPAKGFAAACIFHCQIMSAACLSEPAHAMG
ncbi:hypothetical protein D3C85_1543870 [compost metagenome]